MQKKCFNEKCGIIFDSMNGRTKYCDIKCRSSYVKKEINENQCETINKKILINGHKQIPTNDGIYICIGKDGDFTFSQFVVIANRDYSQWNLFAERAKSANWFCEAYNLLNLNCFKYLEIDKCDCAKCSIDLNQFIPKFMQKLLEKNDTLLHGIFKIAQFYLMKDNKLIIKFFKKHIFFKDLLEDLKKNWIQCFEDLSISAIEIIFLDDPDEYFNKLTSIEKESLVYAKKLIEDDKKPYALSFYEAQNKYKLNDIIEGNQHKNPVAVHSGNISSMIKKIRELSDNSTQQYTKV